MQFELNFLNSDNYSFNKSKCRVIAKSLNDFAKTYDRYFELDRNKKDNFFELPITAIKTAYQCPWLFYQSIGNDNIFRTQFRYSPKVFNIGSMFDSSCRKFISATPLKRIHLHKELRDELEFKLSKGVNVENIDFPYVKPKENQYLIAFDNFCETFKYHSILKVSDRFNESSTLKIKINSLILSGKIDLLIKSLLSDGFILIDIKLKKFGDSIDTFSIEEFIQVLLYTYALKKNEIEIDGMGYYYGVDNTLIYIDLKNTKQEYIYELTERLLLNVQKANVFYPKKCELCLICPFKENCKIGKNITINDFDIPLH